jgi:SAM-dependent methyltransferase
MTIGTPSQVGYIRGLATQLGQPYVSGSSGKAGYSYLPIPFSEFRDIPNHRPDSHERFTAIRQTVNLSGRHVVDLGCATGFFCFRSADFGAQAVVGVEYDNIAFKICNALQRLYAYHPAKLIFVEGLVEDNLTLIKDIVFVMSIAHWVRIRSGDLAMHKFLEEIASRAKLAFIELPTAGSGGAGIPWLKTQDDVCLYLHDCGFDNVEPIVEVASHAGRRTTWAAQRTVPITEQTGNPVIS